MLWIVFCVISAVNSFKLNVTKKVVEHVNVAHRIMIVGDPIGLENCDPFQECLTRYMVKKASD